jgi:hypothetical protein
MKTAVEWLVQELTKNKFIAKNGDFTNPLIEQALEMEKEQIIGLLKWMNKVASEEPMRFETDADDIVEQYYTEVYGKE